MDVANYVEKPGRQLTNKEHYRKPSKDQTAAKNETVNNVIERFHGKSNYQIRS